MRKPSGDDWAKRLDTSWRWIETSGESGRRGVERTGAGERMLPLTASALCCAKREKQIPHAPKCGGFGMTLRALLRRSE
jgi:hypothetical protein